MLSVLKKSLKAGLHRFGLLGPAQYLYFNMKTASPAVLKHELQFRKKNAPDGYPLPPPALIYDVIACRWGAVFLSSGKEVVDDMERVLVKNRKSLAAFESILDFGCGCGRLIRQVKEQTPANLFGSDYNGRLVDWCAKNLSFAQFSKNELAPPLQFADDSFDFIYARSVFTHLPLDLQLAWIKELRRVLKPGGWLYLTMHGKPMSGGLTGKQLDAFNAGQLVETYATVAGENLCSTFATVDFVKENLLEGFALVDFVEGRGGTHLRQDIYLLERRG